MNEIVIETLKTLGELVWRILDLFFQTVSLYMIWQYLKYHDRYKSIEQKEKELEKREEEIRTFYRERAAEYYAQKPGSSTNYERWKSQRENSD